MPDKYITIGPSGFPTEKSGRDSYGGAGTAGQLVALGSDGKISSSLVASSSGGGSSVDYTIRVDEITVDLIYVGRALPGSLEADPVWQIYRCDFSGTEVVKLYADGTSDFSKVWDDRLLYTYS